MDDRGSGAPFTPCVPLLGVKVPVVAVRAQTSEKVDTPFRSLPINFCLTVSICVHENGKQQRHTI